MQSIEQGVLMTEEVVTTFSNAGGEGIWTELVVPAGYKYIIKNVATTTSTFIGTMTSSSTYLEVTSIDNKIDLVISASTTYSYFFGIPLTLSPGEKIKLRLVSSAWTSGQLKGIFLFQKVKI